MNPSQQSYCKVRKLTQFHKWPVEHIFSITCFSPIDILKSYSSRGYLYDKSRKEMLHLYVTSEGGNWSFSIDTIVPFGLRCFLTQGQFDQISPNIKFIRNNQLTVSSDGHITCIRKAQTWLRNEIFLVILKN